MVVVEYFNTIRDRPVLPSVQPGFMRESLPSEMPTDGVKWEEIQPDIEKTIMVRQLFELIVAWDNALATSEILFLVSL
jgi:hypothetical protein